MVLTPVNWAKSPLKKKTIAKSARFL